MLSWLTVNSLKRYAVLFGQSPSSLQKDSEHKIDKEFSSSGGYFQRRITRMLKTENLAKSTILLEYAS